MQKSKVLINKMQAANYKLSKENSNTSTGLKIHDLKNKI